MACKCGTNKVLDTPIDFEEGTLRETFKLLLKTLFHEGDGFSGKRPLGESGWESGIGIALVKAGLLKGTFKGDDGYDDADFTWEDFHKVTDEAIEAL